MERRLKHKCPTNHIWSDKHGKCIQPDLETKHKDCSQLDVDLNRCIPEKVSGAEDPNSRSKASPNLSFPTHMKKGQINKV